MLGFVCMNPQKHHTDGHACTRVRAHTHVHKDVRDSSAFYTIILIFLEMFSQFFEIKYIKGAFKVKTNALFTFFLYESL